jgi:hypothetical protein
MTGNLDAWKERETTEIDLGDGLTLTVRAVDPIMMLAGSNGDAPNPLLGIIFEEANKSSGIDFQKEIKNKPDLLRPLADMLRTFALRAIVDPPLTENGHPSEESISVDVIPFEAKMKVFEFVMGGSEALNAAQKFPEVQASSVVAAPERKGVSTSAVEHDVD